MNKKMKSFVCLLLAAVMLLGCVGCKDNSNKTSGEKALHTVRVVNQSGAGLQGVGVYVYEDNTQSELVWYDVTNEAGEMTFTDVQRSTYVAVLADVPTGYAVEESYPLTGLTTEICLSAGTMTGEEEITYELGDLMMDFTFTAADGKEYSLYGLLEEKQAVILNFYYNGCVPCQMEFPYLQEAYEAYADQVAVVAMNPVDKEDAVAAFQKEHGLSFLMSACNENWQNIMQITAYPTTVVVDRFGKIVLMHCGGIDSAQTFKDVFAAVTGDDYEQKIYQNLTEIETTAQMGTKENPEMKGPTAKFELELEGGQEYYIEFLRLKNLTLQIKDPDAYVIYNDKKYEPKNGVVSLLVTCPDTNTPAIIVFGNASDKTKTFTITMASQPGSIDNPYDLKEGENQVKIGAGNDQGVYYIWTAPENGSLRAWCTSATAGVKYDCVLYNLTSYAQRSLEGEGKTDEEGHRYVEVLVNKGDRVQMIAAVLPDDSWNYPAGNFVYQVLFTEGEGRDKDKEEKTTYTVTVTDDKDQPIANVNLHTLVKDEATDFATNAEGIATIDLPTDTYKITVIIPEGYTSEITEFELTKEAPTYTLKLTEKVVVMADYTVTVVDANEAPMADVSVIIGSQFANTDAEGKAVFNLEQGEYTVQVVAPEGYVTAEDSYSFPENETALTITLDYAPGTKNNPITIYALQTVTDPIAAGQTVYYELFRLGGLVMTIDHADVQVTIGDETYTADETGKVELIVPMLGSAMEPVPMALTNGGTSGCTYTINLTYPLGHSMNPEVLETLGQLTTDLEAGNTSGYHYTWTAQQEGVVTFYLASVTQGAVGNISLTNNTNSVNRTLLADGKGGLVTLNVAAGDMVAIQVLTSTYDAEDNYVGNPAAQIVSVGSFTAQENTTDPKITYSVRVTDGAGYAMENVAVTIGNQELTTDENGLAFVQLVEGSYVATVTAPEGYYLTNNQFTLTVDMPQAEVMLDAVVFVDYQIDLSYDGAVYTGQTKVQLLDGSVVVYEETTTTGSVTVSLPEGTYTVKLVLTDGTLIYTAPQVSAAAPTANITLAKAKTYTDYTVAVTDANGAAQAGILVQILKGEQIITTANTDANGKITKNLESDNYTVRLTFSGQSFYYNPDIAVLSASAPNLTIQLANEVDPENVYSHWVINNQNMYVLSEGSTHVQVSAGKPYYTTDQGYGDCLFLFEPTRTGTFRITIDRAGVELRNYGSSPYYIFIADQSSKHEDNALPFELKSADQVGHVFMFLGVEVVEGITDLCITITRVGEPGFDISAQPWSTEWQTGYTPVQQTVNVPSGKKLNYVDIKGATDAYTIVYNESDGFYHVGSKTGPILYLNLGAVTKHNISLNEIINGTAEGAGGAPIRRYFFDADGTFIKKEDYTDVIKGYIAKADTKYGLYPVNKELAYILQTAKPGWWDVTSPDYLLEDCNPELGWLFACCYIQ